MIIAKNSQLPLKTVEKLIHLPNDITRSELAEVRLRAGRPAVAVTISGKNRVCSDTLSANDINECFAELCQYSIHSFAREIREGYITIAGGHRAGFCGNAVIRNGCIDTLRDISSINLRIAHEIKGCADELYGKAFKNGLCSLLIAGRPLSGKTTLLRDLTRLIGNHSRVALIDSRNEIAAVYNGSPQLDVGINTDVLSGYPRAQAIETALRTLSPEIIICDEIGSDISAIKECAHCGVKLIATIHSDSVEQLASSVATKGLLDCFDRVAIIAGKGRLVSVQPTENVLRKECSPT